MGFTGGYAKPGDTNRRGSGGLVTGGTLGMALSQTVTSQVSVPDNMQSSLLPIDVNLGVLDVLHAEVHHVDRLGVHQDRLLHPLVVQKH